MYLHVRQSTNCHGRDVVNLEVGSSPKFSFRAPSSQKWDHNCLPRLMLKKIQKRATLVNVFNRKKSRTECSREGASSRFIPWDVPTSHGRSLAIRRWQHSVPEGQGEGEKWRTIRTVFRPLWACSTFFSPNSLLHTNRGCNRGFRYWLRLFLRVALLLQLAATTNIAAACTCYFKAASTRVRVVKRVSMCMCAMLFEATEYSSATSKPHWQNPHGLQNGSWSDPRKTWWGGHKNSSSSRMEEFLWMGCQKNWRLQGRNRPSLDPGFLTVLISILCDEGWEAFS